MFNLVTSQISGELLVGTQVDPLRWNLHVLLKEAEYLEAENNKDNFQEKKSPESTCVKLQRGVRVEI